MKLRRIIVFVVTFVTVFAFSCGSVFAKNNADLTINLPLANDVTGIIGTLNSSALDEAGFKFMQDYVNGVGCFVVTYTGSINFIRFPFNVTKSNFPYSSYYDALDLKTSYEVISFNLSTGDPYLSNGSFINKVSVASRANCFFDFQFLLDLGVLKKDISYIWKPLKNVGLTILFDKSLVDEPEPPTSSTPTSSEPVSSEPVSSEPTSSAPTSSEPTKPPPINEEYLGISPSVVTDIFSYFRSVAGASTNIGIMVFIFIVGIFITVSIFRYFFD